MSDPNKKTNFRAGKTSATNLYPCTRFAFIVFRCFTVMTRSVMTNRYNKHITFQISFRVFIGHKLREKSNCSASLPQIKQRNYLSGDTSSSPYFGHSANLFLSYKIYDECHAHSQCIHFHVRVAISISFKKVQIYLNTATFLSKSLFFMRVFHSSCLKPLILLVKMLAPPIIVKYTYTHII